MFTLTFSTNYENGNKGFQAARILREIAEDVENGSTSGSVKDASGKHIGNWSLS